MKDAALAMREEDAGFLPVVADGQLVGVLTDRDIVLRCIAEGTTDPVEGTVGEVMSTEVKAVSPGLDLEDAAQLMANAQIRRLPVVDDSGALVGVLSHGNLVQATKGQGPGPRVATEGVTRGA